MPINFSKPVTTDNYSTGVLQNIRDAINALGQWLDPAVAGTLTSTPTGAYRINAGAIERYNGTSWVGQAVQGISFDGSVSRLGGTAAFATRLGTTAVTPALQNLGTTGAASSNLNARFSADSNGPALYLAKSRGAVGAHTLVLSNDQLGVLTFGGSDGAKMVEGAAIRAAVEGTAALDAMPTRLQFLVNGGSSAAPSEAMRLTSAGRLLLGTTSDDGANLLQVAGAASFAGALSATSTARFGGATYGTLGVRSGGAYGGTGANTNIDDIVMENSGGAGMTILTPNTAAQHIAFGDPESNTVGTVRYRHSVDTLDFSAGQTYVLALTAAGAAVTGTLTVSSTLSGSNLTNTSGYFTLHPYSAASDDGSVMKAYWNGNAGNIVFSRSGGTGTAGVRLQCDVVGDITGTGTLAAGSTVGGQAIGYLGLPTIAHQATAAATAKGKCILATGNVTINSGVFSDGDSIVIANTLGTSISIVDGTIATMRLSGTTTTGTRTLGPYGEAVLHFIGTEVRVSGSGVS